MAGFRSDSHILILLYLNLAVVSYIAICQLAQYLDYCNCALEAKIHF